MGGQNIQRLMLDGVKSRVNDPGDAGTINVHEMYDIAVPLVTSSAETRTIAAPDEIGKNLAVFLKTDGGDCTLTVTSGYDQAGSTSITFSDPGDCVFLKSIDDNGTIRWQAYYLVSGGDVATLDDIQLDDDVSILFGTGNDTGLNWNGTYLETSRTGFYTAMPSKADPLYDQVAFEVFEDFLNPASATASDLMAWTEIDDCCTGTNSFLDDEPTGIYQIITAGADNDYHAITSVNETFRFESGKKLWFLARIRLTEANTNESAWWVGLTDTLTTGGLQANALGPLASYDGALIWKDEGTLAIDFETSNAGTQATTTDMATFASGTWTTVGFYFDGTATTSTITPYYNVAGGTALTAGTAQDITLTGLEEMHIVAGVKAGPMGGAETLQVDFLKCVQLR